MPTRFNSSTMSQPSGATWSCTMTPPTAPCWAPPTPSRRPDPAGVPAVLAEPYQHLLHQALRDLVRDHPDPRRAHQHALRPQHDPAGADQPRDAPHPHLPGGPH
ncbi:MAG: hypothetical protein ACTSQI_13805 [Candidatus Helarchaeota archaeon]